LATRQADQQNGTSFTSPPQLLLPSRVLSLRAFGWETIAVGSGCQSDFTREEVAKAVTGRDGCVGLKGMALVLSLAT